MNVKLLENAAKYHGQNFFSLILNEDNCKLPKSNKEIMENLASENYDNNIIQPIK